MTQVPTRWHRPGAHLDYLFDWTDGLAAGDTIAAAAVSIVTSSTMTIDAGTIVSVGAMSAMGVQAWVTGGAVGDRGRLLCTITTAAGRTDTMALDLTVGYEF